MTGNCKVLFLTQGFIRKKGDMAGAFLFDLSKALFKKRVEVSVLAPHQKGLSLRERIDGIYVYRFRYAPARYERLAYGGRMHEMVMKGIFNKLLFVNFIVSFVLNALALTKREKIELIHAHWWIPSGVVALVVSRILGRPYVVTSHGTDVFILRKFQFLKPVARIIFKRASLITAVSNSIKSILVNEVGVSPHKIRVFPMPCDLSLFYPVFEESHRGRMACGQVQSGVKAVLSVGRLVEQKGFEYLVDAVKILKERGLSLNLTIIGEGPEEKSLRDRIGKLGLSEAIEIIPYQPKAKLNDFYNLCDVFVLPSITDSKGEQEGLGLVLLEAMACKKPVIGTNSGGIPDIVKDLETGLLVPEKDSEALADAIEKLLKDKELANRLAENGYKFVLENFTPSKTAKKTIGAYKEVHKHIFKHSAIH